MRVIANNGLEAATDLGATAYHVWHAVLGRPEQPWEKCDQVPWQEVAVMAISQIDLPQDEMAMLEVSAKQFAQDLHQQFLAAQGLEGDFEDLKPEEQIAWEAVGRHLANCIDADSAGVDIGTFEERVLEWAAERI
jgi:hypothetical protein